jgi:hypothetical protein
VNRDASLLFDDQELAEYFATVFDHDWNNLTSQNIGVEWYPAELVPPGESIGAGLMRLNWKDYVELL